MIRLPQLGTTPLPLSASVGRTFFGIANQFWWTIFATAILWYVLNRTRFGAHIFLTGDNKISAQLMGVNVNAVKRRTFAIMGFFAAFAGLVSVGK
jgi:simple sugar transport system permease protein